MMVIMPIYGKTFINLLLQSKSPMILEFSMLNRKLLSYKQYLNDNPGLTLTVYTARSNLVVCGLSLTKAINVYSPGPVTDKSNRKAMNRNWAIKRQIPLLKPKRE